MYSFVFEKVGQTGLCFLLIYFDSLFLFVLRPLFFTFSTFYLFNYFNRTRYRFNACKMTPADFTFQTTLTVSLSLQTRI